MKIVSYDDTTMAEYQVAAGKTGASVTESTSDLVGKFTAALTLIFIVMKLTGFITWSWWMVTSPLWGGFFLFWVYFMIIAIFLGKFNETSTSRPSRKGR